MISFKFFFFLIRLPIFRFQGFGKRAVLVLSDANSGGWEKIGSVNLQSCGQILKETRRIENLVGTDKMCKIVESSPSNMLIK